MRINTSNRFCYIYGLRDPGNETIMYVGKTINPFVRLHQHIFDLYSTNAKSIWIQTLLDEHVFPVLDIIDVCLENEAHEREVFWINYHKRKNPGLLNKFMYNSTEGHPITVSDLFTVTQEPQP